MLIRIRKYGSVEIRHSNNAFFKLSRIKKVSE